MGAGRGKFKSGRAPGRTGPPSLNSRRRCPRPFPRSETNRRRNTASRWSPLPKSLPPPQPIRRIATFPGAHSLDRQFPSRSVAWSGAPLINIMLWRLQLPLAAMQRSRRTRRAQTPAEQARPSGRGLTISTPSASDRGCVKTPKRRLVGVIAVNFKAKTRLKSNLHAQN